MNDQSMGENPHETVQGNVPVGQGYPHQGHQQAPHGQQQPYQPYGQQPQPHSLTTHPAGGAYNAYSAPAGQMGRERNILAAILIGAGVFFFIQQFVHFNFGAFVMPLVGAAFIAAYLNTRAAYRVGFLIPGSIILGIGVGNLLENYTPIGNWGIVDVSGLALGLGFCLIWALERRQWWALIPGGILVASSLANFWAVTRLWPLALILLGGYLLYDQYRRHQKR